MSRKSVLIGAQLVEGTTRVVAVLPHSWIS